jgi:hypothetical protein
MLLSGNGSITAFGNIQVNSDCNPGALRRQGGGNITIDVDSGACNVVGDISDGGGTGVIDCVQTVPFIRIRSRTARRPIPAAPFHAVDRGRPVPSSCPGSATRRRRITRGLSSSRQLRGRSLPVRPHPGISTRAARSITEPGIYYLSGGGLDIRTGPRPSRSTAAAATGRLGWRRHVLPPRSPVRQPAVILNQGLGDDRYPALDDPTSSTVVIYQDRDIDIDPAT